METVLTVVISMVGGGAFWTFIVKVFDIKSTEATSIRKELREENTELRKAIDGVTKLYNDQQRAYNELHAMFKELESDGNINKKELERLRKKVQELEKYKNQSRIIARMKLYIRQYESDKDTERLMKALKTELELT